MMASVLAVDSLGVMRANNRILDGVTFTVDRDETVLVQGRSGAGKSTLFHVLALLEQATEGSISIDGVETTSLGDRDRTRIRREHVGVVFQEFHLVPDLTAYENARLPQEHAGSIEADWLDTLFDELSIDGLRDQYPRSLSGGEKQRIAIARALANQPDIVLADEPTGQLDPTTASGVLDLLFEVCGATNSALLVISHDPALHDRFDTHYFLESGRLLPD
ncbi:MAG: ABC transporter ATP-binding protein [Halapricum sp.]